jgi:hypothetical protein
MTEPTTDRVMPPGELELACAEEICITPEATWSTGKIAAIITRVVAGPLRAEIERLKQACARQGNEVSQVLGKALGYPPLYPEASDTDDGQVCVGDHAPESIADEAAGKIGELRVEVERLKGELEVYDLAGKNLASDFDEFRAQRDELLAAGKAFMRCACRPGDDGKYDNSYSDAKEKLKAAIARAEAGQEGTP